MRAFISFRRPLSRPAICLLLAIGLSAPIDAAATESASPTEQPALVLERGSIARRQLVAIGRDLHLLGEAHRDVAVLQGEARVSGSIRGNLVVLGGDVSLESGAHIGGDVFALGGEIRASPDVQVEGRSVAYPGAPSSLVVLLGGPALGLSALSPVVLGAKLALVAAWLLISLLLLSAFPGALQATAESVRRQPFRDFFLGLVASSTLALGLLLFSTFSGALIGIPLALVVVLFALLLKLWGTVAVFSAAGGWLVRRLDRRHELPLTVTLIGLVALSVIKIVPWLGTLVWSIVTLIGMGAALATKFGQLQPWFNHHSS